eukprot:m.165260 g.165260  ORF g.165260 m.165260 type:complete len:507 (-) comp15256_c1_seq1:56-1576(-)
MGLTQDDFRKLMMTPRPGATSSLAESASTATATTETVAKKKIDPAKRKKKKEYLKRVEEKKAEAKEKEDKYRDRAAERRKGINKDYEDHEKLLEAYKDVAPAGSDEEGDASAIDKQKQEIEKSKYLGGDIKHTHLVKGLDFALLEKERARLAAEENEEQSEEEEMEEEESGLKPKNRAERRAMEKSKMNKSKNKAVVKEKEVKPDPEAVTFRTRMARGVYNLVMNKEEKPKKNDLFATGRMAYVVDLESKFREMTVPTTLIRSKADCPDKDIISSTTTSDLVINKLTQILQYIRAGTRQSRKLRKKEKIKSKGTTQAPVDLDLDMYADLATDDSEVKPAEASKVKSNPSAAKSGSYFGEKKVEDTMKQEEEAAKALAAKLLKQYSEAEEQKQKTEEAAKEKKKKIEKKRGANTMDAIPDVYAECYPGADQMMMSFGGSDDEYDDGDDQKSWKKPAGGEKGTSKKQKGAEKQKLNQELGEINRFIEKRKAEGGMRRTKKKPKPDAEA